MIIGQNVDKLEPLYYVDVGGNIKWGTHYGKQYGGLSKN